MKTALDKTSFKRYWEFGRITQLQSQTEAPKMLKEYLQLWGFTEEEASDFCEYMMMQKTEDLKRLSQEDWKTGGDIDALNLSDTKKEYIKWLWNKLKERKAA